MIQRLRYEILLLALILLSCKKDGFESGQLKWGDKFYPIPQDLKDYTVFEKGSYWVYKSDKGDTDSIYVKELRYYKYEESDGVGFETYDQYKHSSYQNDEIVGQSGTNLQSEPPHYSESTTLFILTDEQGELVGNYKIEYKNHYDTLEVGGKQYHDVREFQINTPISEKADYKVFFSRHVGIIKRIQHDSTTWELERFKVIQ